MQETTSILANPISLNQLELEDGITISSCYGDL